MNVELEAAEALLDEGVSVPFRNVKLPFVKHPIQLRIVMRRPCLGNQIRIAKEYLKLGYTTEQMEEFTKEEEFAFLAQHGKRISRMVALTVCRGPFTGWLLTPLVSMIIRWFVPDIFIRGANDRFITLMGTQAFMNIIRSAERTNPLRPRLSQKRKGS